jgi:sodium-dependent dicarboxylate transporter 2/3/5
LVTFPEAPEITFGAWFLMGLPLSLLMLAVTWLLLTRVFYRAPGEVRLKGDTVRDELTLLGPMSHGEKAVAVIFVSTALLWIFRKPLSLGAVTVPGWSELLPYGDLLDDGTVSLSMAFLLFIVPARDGTGRTLAGPDIFKDLPWHIVLLFGGGFALAKGFQESGLTALIGDQFAGLAGTPVLPVIGVVCGGLTFLTELTSNTATTEMILPPLASVAVAMEINPLLLMIPATLSASCAFMMPVATPPNAIVFGSGRISVAEMVRVGFFLNLIGIAMITLFVYTIGAMVLGIEPGLPAWAITK